MMREMEMGLWLEKSGGGVEGIGLMLAVKVTEGKALSQWRANLHNINGSYLVH